MTRERSPSVASRTEPHVVGVDGANATAYIEAKDGALQYLRFGKPFKKTTGAIVIGNAGESNSPLMPSLATQLLSFSDGGFSRTLTKDGATARCAASGTDVVCGWVESGAVRLGTAP
jgi:hypothetical protein